MANYILLGELRKHGVKSATFSADEKLTSVEFFPLAAPPIPPLDLDTLIPPPPAEDGPPNEPPRSQFKTAPALAALLTKPSVS